MGFLSSSIILKNDDPHWLRIPASQLRVLRASRDYFLSYFAPHSNSHLRVSIFLAIGSRVEEAAIFILFCAQEQLLKVLKDKIPSPCWEWRSAVD